MQTLSAVFQEYQDLKEINPKSSEQSVRRLIELNTLRRPNMRLHE